MLNWFRQWRINRLLCERAKLQGEVDAWGDMEYFRRHEYGQIAEINEKLRQLGHDEKKTVVRTGLPENYLKKMLDEANRIAGEQDNG